MKAESASRESGCSLIPSRSGPAATIGGKSGEELSSFLPSSSSAHMIFHLEIGGVFIIANASLWRDDGERGCEYYFAVYR